MITTNLDILIEKAYEDLTGEKPRVIVDHEDFVALAEELEVSGTPKCATVVKPHGTIDTRYEDPERRYKSGIYFRLFLPTVGASSSSNHFL